MDWLDAFLASSTSALNINNTLGSWFPNRRGLKQGNPLSPLLFILIADTLTRILETANSEKLLEGFDDFSITRQVLSLHFTDDTLIFLKADKQYLNTLKFILYAYELATGLKINFQKSQFIGLGISDLLGKKLADMLGCQASRLPIQYLGLPLDYTTPRNKD